MIKGSHHSEETKAKMRLNHADVRGDKNPMYGKPSAFLGKHHTKETKRKIGDRHRGKEVSEETRRKLSETHKGREFSEETRALWSKQRTGNKNPMYGKHHSEEAKKKMSEAQKGKKHSKEHRQKIGKSISGENHPNWQGGIGKLPYAFDFNKELKGLIKERDGYTCQFPDCGAIEDLVVHHCDYNKQNSDPKNLLTLCRHHNFKVNYNRESWTEYFKEMIHCD